MKRKRGSRGEGEGHSSSKRKRKRRREKEKVSVELISKADYYIKSVEFRAWLSDEVYVCGVVCVCVKDNVSFAPCCREMCSSVTSLLRSQGSFS